jgi:CubicO group peptidase (beta-lactamase class C family)
MLHPERLLSAFQKNFAERNELGAAISIWRDGEEILHLHDGYRSRDATTPWTPDTLVPVWSATKGIAAATTLTALHENHIPLENEVRYLWPEFAQANKQWITLRQLLAHTAGLSALDEKVSILDYQAVIAALERQAPSATPGSSQAYHARTFGFLLEELVRRSTGASSLGSYYHERIRQPLAADFWIGLPESEHARVATLYPGRIDPKAPADPFLAAFQTPGSLTQRSFQSPSGLNAVADLNLPATWQLGLASMGGVGSARGLARLYAALATDGEGVFPEAILPALQNTVSSATDAVLMKPLAFSAGMMQDPLDLKSHTKLRQLMGPSRRAFGHPGAGGSLAFADPDARLSFAYVMNQMELNVLPTVKATDLVDAVFSGS